jgi:hypothetical protein
MLVSWMQSTRCSLGDIRLFRELAYGFSWITNPLKRIKSGGDAQQWERIAGLPVILAAFCKSSFAKVRFTNKNIGDPSDSCK